MADGCEPFIVAGALGAPGAERIHAIRLLHLFSFSPEFGRDSLLPARFEELLGGVDVFGSCLCVWLCFLDVLPGTKPVVHICWHVNQGLCPGKNIEMT